MPGPEPEFIKWLITLGVGGVLAGFMFVFYRKDIKQYTELWKITTDQMTTVVKENTASNVRLIAMLEAAERNALRKTDIDALVERRIRSGKVGEDSS
jgi:hypothetical protein